MGFVCLFILYLCGTKIIFYASNNFGQSYIPNSFHEWLLLLLYSLISHHALIYSFNSLWTKRNSRSFIHAQFIQICFLFLSITVWILQFLFYGFVIDNRIFIIFDFAAIVIVFQSDIAHLFSCDRTLYFPLNTREARWPQQLDPHLIQLEEAQDEERKTWVLYLDSIPAGIFQGIPS